MPKVTLSSKNQITLPVGMVRILGLEAGDILTLIQAGDHLALFPKSASFPDSIAGSMKGFWGTREEIDRYVAQERASWGNKEDDWLEQVEDLLASNEEARKIVGKLKQRPRYAGPTGDIERIKAADPGKVRSALEELKRLGAVREIPPPPDWGAGPWVRLVRKVANCVEE
ncbi:MAG: hypothetical protein Q7K03_02575 [Dehalococcoidia bacterium]|nr:hypothetical protein [Dehalococcoidia bacterium]